MTVKSEIIKKILKTSNVHSDDEPAAFFMAGLPGSGKTEISRNLIKDSGVHLFRIDMDEMPGSLRLHEKKSNIAPLNLKVLSMRTIKP